jgi:hypothetical protein
MRIAVTGTHGSGKTTLIDDFLAAHPGYAHEQEPYWALAQQGVIFADGPNVADLEQQFDHSVAMILDRSGDGHVIFDHSPIDFLAYLEVVGPREGSDWSASGRQLVRLQRALAALDLLVFLPLAEPDEIATRIEYPRLRAAVDRRLKILLYDDPLDLFTSGTPRLLELQGSRRRRLDRLSRVACAP